MGHFGGFPVKIVRTPGLPRNPNQQRKRYTPGFPVKTVRTPSLPGNPNQQRKRYTPHLISEVLPRVDFALPGCPGPSSTLRKTSEMTPRWPKWPKITSKGGKPPFLHDFLAKLCSFNPKLETALKNMGVGGHTRTHKKIYLVTLGGGGDRL